MFKDACVHNSSAEYDESVTVQFLGHPLEWKEFIRILNLSVGPLRLRKTLVFQNCLG
jgi:hypothetical protein